MWLVHDRLCEPSKHWHVTIATTVCSWDEIKKFLGNAWVLWLMAAICSVGVVSDWIYNYIFNFKRIYSSFDVMTVSLNSSIRQKFISVASAAFWIFWRPVVTLDSEVVIFAPVWKLRLSCKVNRHMTREQWLLIM